MARQLEDLFIDSDTNIDINSQDKNGRVYSNLDVGLTLPSLQMDALLGYVRTVFGDNIDLLQEGVWQYEDTDLIGISGLTKISGETLISLLSFEGIETNTEEILKTALNKISKTLSEEIRFYTDK